MFKRITTLFLALAIFTTASSVSVFARAKSGDDTQTVSQNSKPNSEKLRETFLKKENKPNLDAKDNLSAHQKQTAQKSRFSTSTKILIGVGVAAALIVTVLVVNNGFKEAANPF